VADIFSRHGEAYFRAVEREILQLLLPLRHLVVATGGGLLFVATSSDRKLRAYDEDSGKVVWEKDLPAASEGVPTYGIELVTPRSNASLCLFQTQEKPALLHIAFEAQSREEVDAFHRAALEAGARDNGPPGIRAKYSPNYYAAFVIDPDGHNIEAVFHEPRA